MKTITELMPIDKHALDGMEIGDSKSVLLASPHTRDGYYLGYSGTQAVSTGSGFDSIDTMIATGETIKTDSSYIWTITKKTDTIFTLTCNGYTPYGDSEENVLWTSSQEMEFTLSDGLEIPLGATTYMSTGYQDKYCIRLQMRINTTLYLNMGGRVANLKYYPGDQEWSVWYILEDKYKSSTPVYIKDSNSWKKVSTVWYKTDDKWHKVKQISKKVSDVWVS